MTHDRTALLLWSGGKDALLALRAAREQVEVTALMTTVLEDAETVTMHGTPLPLIEEQAKALGLPLHVMRIPQGASNAVYEERMGEALAGLREDIEVVLSGDLFLEDIRAYREEQFANLGMEIAFPIWQREPSALARTFLEESYRAVVTSVDTTQLDDAFAGRRYDARFLADLPEEVDPCGEHGAFHTFVTDGPLFDQPVPVKIGETVQEGRMARVQITTTAPPVSP